jgi:hypothetical protein
MLTNHTRIRCHRNNRGEAYEYGILWLMGVPLPFLFLIYLVRGR